MESNTPITVLARHSTHKRDLVLWRWICEECGELHNRRRSHDEDYPEELTCICCGSRWAKTFFPYRRPTIGAVYSLFGFTRLGLLAAG